MKDLEETRNHFADLKDAPDWNLFQDWRDMTWEDFIKELIENNEIPQDAINWKLA